MVIVCEGKLSCVIRQPGKNLQMTLYKQLVSSGMIRHERRRILAVAMVDRWPAQDSRHKVQVRQRVDPAEPGTPRLARQAGLVRPPAPTRLQPEPRRSRPRQADPRPVRRYDGILDEDR